MGLNEVVKLQGQSFYSLRPPIQQYFMSTEPNCGSEDIHTQQYFMSSEPNCADIFWVISTRWGTLLNYPPLCPCLSYHIPSNKGTWFYYPLLMSFVFSSYHA